MIAERLSFLILRFSGNEWPHGPLSAAPAFFILFSICTSLYIGSSLHSAAAASCAILLTAALIFIGTRKIVPGWFPIFAIVILISTILSVNALFEIKRESLRNGYIELSGKVVSSREMKYGRAITVDTKLGRFAGYLSRDDCPREGSGVSLRGIVTDFRRAKESGKFDELTYWRSRGASKKLIFFDIKEIRSPSGIAAWRAKLERLIDSRLLPLSASYIAAFTVGRRDSELEELHRSAGTAHLLAVSGLHVWLIAGILMIFLRGNLQRLIGISIFLWGYLLLVGLPLSGVRAALMVELALIAAAMGRPESSLNAVSVAAILLLLYNPWNFWNIGWRLSVLCALFISAGAPIMRGSAILYVVASVLLWFIAAPLLAQAFGSVPRAGLILNAIAVPAFGIIFPIILLLALPPILNLPLSWVAAEASEAILSTFQQIILRGVELLPGDATWSAPLFCVSTALFTLAAALRCGAGIKRSAVTTLFLIFFLFYCRIML